MWATGVMHNQFKIGQIYKRTDIDQVLKTERFSQSREGIVSFKNQIFLFTTLEKKLKEKQFHYNDFFAEDLFHWDSQNSQHIQTPMIQKMVLGTSEVYLFSRILEKVRSKSQPFVYCGRLEYLEHEASTRNPVHIVFENIDYQDSPNQNLAEIYSWKPGLGKPGTTRQVATRTSKRTSAAKQQTSQSSKPSSSNAKPSGGQGYEQNPLVRKAIENRAMQVAKSVYEKNGYSVEDTSANSSYDLRCTKEGKREILVEVKGTRGLPTQVTLTANEVKISQDPKVRWDLFIVHSISVSKVNEEMIAEGGEVKLHQNHIVDDADLTPTEFRYKVPDDVKID